MVALWTNVIATKLSNNLTCLSEAFSTQYSPDTTLALLQTSTAQAEEEAEVRNILVVA